MTLAMSRDLRQALPGPTRTADMGQQQWESDPPGVWEVTLTDEGVEQWKQIEALPGPQARALGLALLAAGEERWAS